jgi:hypothetical protein
MLNAFINYFRNTQHYSKIRFIAEMTVLAFVLKLIFGIGYFLTTGDTGEQIDQGFDDILAKGWIFTIIFITIFAAAETFIGQWLIIYLTSKFTNNIYIKLFTSAIFFSLLHVDPILIVTIFPVGIIFAWSFILYRRQSRWAGFWVTTLIHIIQNLIATSAIYFWH